MADTNKKPLKIRIGGQAVIEGVMIKSENYYAVSVIKGQKIISKIEKLRARKSRLYKLPIIRGFFNMIDMLKVGMKALSWSAEQSGDENEKITKKEMVITIILSILLTIIFFIMLPYFSAQFFGFKEEKNPVLFNLVDGLIRIIIFLAYLIGISFIPDIKRIFQYHGAEHMTVHCYEKNKELNIKNVRRYQTMHPRCGTSFLLLVFIISIIIFSFTPFIVSFIYTSFNTLNSILKKIVLFFARILMIPLIAGISYEILRISDKFQKNILFKIISLPGIMLQKITTKKPTNRQIGVAINSVKKILKYEVK